MSTPVPGGAQPSQRYNTIAGALLILSSVILILVGLLLALTAHTLNLASSACHDDAHAYLPDPLLLGLAVASLFGGAVLGKQRYEPGWKDAGPLYERAATRYEQPSSTSPGARPAAGAPAGRIRRALGALQRPGESLFILWFMLFCAGSTIAVLYEAVGVQQDSILPGVALQPITHYVRCIIVYDMSGASHGALTYLVVVLLSLLVGHWLWAWHPREHFAGDQE
jgi:hypothetical protein